MDFFKRLKGMRQRKPMLPFLVALLKKGTQIALKKLHFFMLLKGSKWWLSITIRKWSMSRLAHPAVKGAKTYEDGNSLRRNFILKQSLNFQPGPSHLHRISVET